MTTLDDRVRLAGHKPQEALPLLYGAADLLVHPSIREGWPNVLLESMACGTPVVVTNLDGIDDIVGAPEAGRILAEATPRYIAETVRDLLAAPPARDATRRYADGFDWQSTTAGHGFPASELIGRPATCCQRRSSNPITSSRLSFHSMNCPVGSRSSPSLSRVTLLTRQTGRHSSLSITVSSRPAVT